MTQEEIESLPNKEVGGQTHTIILKNCSSSVRWIIVFFASWIALSRIGCNLTPYEDMKRVDDIHPIFYILTKRNNKLKIIRYVPSERCSVTTGNVFAHVTKNTEIINADNKSDWYEVTSSENSDLRVSLHYGSNHYIYDVKDGCVTPVSRKLMVTALISSIFSVFSIIPAVLIATVSTFLMSKPWNTGQKSHS